LPDKQLRILYVGVLAPEGFSTCTQRMRALEALGHEIRGVDTLTALARKRQTSMLGRLSRRLLGPRDFAGANQAIVKHARERDFDLLWVDSGRTIAAATLQTLKHLRPEMLLVHYNPDDPFGRLGKRDWGTFLAALPHYDVHLVPRAVNVDEYRAAGAQRVEHVMPFWGFAPNIHGPIAVESVERANLHTPVGFVGMAEEERARSLAKLAAAGVSVRIWGDGWSAWRDRLNAGFELGGPSQWGDPYARILSCTDINVAFLRKANRDQHTSRSIEIPACGGFMLAERSPEHALLFSEGAEAEYFGSDDELIDKVRYYLARPEDRKRIAAAGHARCVAEYGNTRLMERLLAAARRDRSEPRP